MLTGNISAIRHPLRSTPATLKLGGAGAIATPMLCEYDQHDVLHNWQYFCHGLRLCLGPSMQRKLLHRPLDALTLVCLGSPLPDTATPCTQGSLIEWNSGRPAGETREREREREPHSDLKRDSKTERQRRERERERERESKSKEKRRGKERALTT